MPIKHPKQSLAHSKYSNLRFPAFEGNHSLGSLFLQCPRANKQRSKGREEAIRTPLASQGGLFSNSCPGAPLCT